MGVAILDCPFCGANQLAMPSVGTRMPPDSLLQQYPRKFAVGAVYCNKCALPIPLLLFATNKTSNVGGLAEIWHADPIATLQRAQLDAEILSAPNKATDLPQHISDKVAKALRQALENHHRDASEEAAATMYRRAIDLALKELFPELSGDLMPRILKLVGDGRLPKTMGDWAHQVRIIGNDGAHDLDGVTKNDLEAARAFGDAFLRYLFTLPTEVEIRRSQTAAP